MALSFRDVERLQRLYRDNQIELRDGKIIITEPSDIVSSEIGVRFIMLLSNWVYNSNAGRVLGASAGFCLPNGDLLSPDVSFVSRERLKRSPRTFTSVVPELIVEIKSSKSYIAPDILSSPANLLKASSQAKEERHERRGIQQILD